MKVFPETLSKNMNYSKTTNVFSKKYIQVPLNPFPISVILIWVICVLHAFQDIELFTMTQYKKEFKFKMLYPPVVPSNVLAEWLSKKSAKQFHCAETEKYAHVTFFFNGGQEKSFEGEERCMVPSPKVWTDPKCSCCDLIIRFHEILNRPISYFFCHITKGQIP